MTKQYLMVLSVAALAFNSGCEGPFRCLAGTQEDDAGVCWPIPDSGSDAATTSDASVVVEAGVGGTTRDAGMDFWAPADAGKLDAQGTQPDTGAPTTDGALGGDASPVATADAATTSGGPQLPMSQAPVDAGAPPVTPPSPPACVPIAETCDGKDSDCDGVIDNGVKNACGGCGALSHAPGEACSNGGQGICAKAGTYACMGETTVCNAPPPSPSKEVCDGIDNDCDGVADNGVTKNACGGCGTLAIAKDTPCSAGVGECAVAGVYACTTNEATACNAVAKAPSAEVCDGKDNNCNGPVDEGVKNECGTCGALPAEVCDGMDNNCNGFIDEGVKNACGTCGSVPAETCDGADNNCDGKIDEGVNNGCGGCAPLFLEQQAYPGLGQLCAYYWDNSANCSTAGIVKCRSPSSAFCDAPKPACAP